MLAATLSTLHEERPDDKKYNKVYYTIINPIHHNGQLYGQFIQSHEWTDGVLAISYRNYAAEPQKLEMLKI